MPLFDTVLDGAVPYGKIPIHKFRLLTEYISEPHVKLIDTFYITIGIYLLCIAHNLCFRSAQNILISVI